MTQPDPVTNTNTASRVLRLALSVALTFAALGLSVLMLVAPADGVPPSGSRAAVASTHTAAAAPTSTPAPPPVVAADAGPALGALSTEAAAGGDQPAGPLSAMPGAIPENAGAASDLLALRDTLQREIDDYQAIAGNVDVAVAVTDLQTGQTVSVGGNVPHKTGCTINMFGLLAIVSEFQAGNASPDSLAYSVKRGIGGSYPPEVKNFLQAVFGSHTGGVYRARELMKSWGMETSFFDHVPYYGGEDPAPNILTALELNNIFVKLYRGQLFDAEWTAYTLGVLRDIAYYVQYILPKYLPAQATVAHKIGYYWDYDGWVNNDAGIVTFTGGDGQEKAYAITYFSQYARTEQIGYSFGARLSKVVWDYMAPKYGVANEAWTPDVYIAPDPTYYPEPTAEPEPEATPAPSITASPTPAATATPAPVPTATPKPSATPKPPVTPVPTLTPAAAP